MWIALSLLAAFAFAANSLILKKSAGHADVILSTVIFRTIAGLLTLVTVFAVGSFPTPTPRFWSILAVVMAPEILGMVLMALALRGGELSLIQPLLGLVPVFVTIGGILVLNETPSTAAAIGVVLVTAGVYCVGLEVGKPWWEPLRSLARSRASWYALGAALSWSFTTVIHKFGIAEVGALPWAASVTLASALLLGLGLAIFARTAHGAAVRAPDAPVPWVRWMAVAGVCFALHVCGIHTALSMAPAGYVISLSATSTLFGTIFGIVLLGERAHARYRVIGAALVTLGAVLVAALG